MGAFVLQPFYLRRFRVSLFFSFFLLPFLLFLPRFSLPTNRGDGRGAGAEALHFNYLI